MILRACAFSLYTPETRFYYETSARTNDHLLTMFLADTIGSLCWTMNPDSNVLATRNFARMFTAQRVTIGVS